VVFTVSVKNLGPDDASGVNVYAYFGEDKEKKLVGSVVAEGTEEVEIEWLPFEAGSVNVRIVVNPLEEDGAIWEISYENNAWVKPMKVSLKEDATIWEDPMFWLLLIVIVVILLIVIAFGRGRGEEEEAVEVVEVVEEDEADEVDEVDEGEEEYDEDEEEDEEEYEDEEYVDEEESPEARPAYKMDTSDEGEEKEADVSAFTVGRM